MGRRRRGGGEFLGVVAGAAAVYAGKRGLLPVPGLALAGAALLFVCLSVSLRRAFRLGAAESVIASLVVALGALVAL